MKYHERTRIIVEMESSNGEIGGIDIEVKCWDKNKAIKISKDETLFIVSSIFDKALKYTKGGEK